MGRLADYCNYKDEYEKTKKQSCITNVFSYCIYFFEVPLIDLLIDEITQLGIITVYLPDRFNILFPNGFANGQLKLCFIHIDMCFLY